MKAEASLNAYTEIADQIEHKDIDDSSTQGSMDIDHRNWESIPPSSPEKASNQTPEPDPTINTSLTKMSLDFIAPGAQANRTPSPASSTHTTQINVTTISEIPPFSPPLPPPPPPPTPSTQLSHRILNLPPVASNRRTSRRRKRSARRSDQRKDRHAYDTEEKYAIIYLRVIRNLEWNKVLLFFNTLFSPGEPRRCYIPSSPGAGMGGSEGEHASLPSRYTQRNVQGLQCRWYRIRQEEGLVKLRESRRVGFLSPGVGRKEKKVLERMERAGEVGRKLLESLNGGLFCAKL